MDGRRISAFGSKVSRVSSGRVRGAGVGTASRPTTSGCCGPSPRTSAVELKLSAEQIRLLERYSAEFRERHIEVSQDESRWRSIPSSPGP